MLSRPRVLSVLAWLAAVALLPACTSGGGDSGGNPGGTNNPPVASAQGVTLDEDGFATIVLTATDAENDPLTYSVVTQPAHGTLSAVNGANITYTPGANYHGPDSLSFSANDGTADSNVATVTITVNSVNDAPVANSQGVTTSEEVGLAITLTASDLDNDPLLFSIVAQPTHGTLNAVTGTNVTYTPSASYTGADSFTFRASDGLDDSNTATVSITVTASGPPLTGRFLDGAVAGLHYQTDSGFGSTNANGEFQYLNGETVRFFVGDILVGQAAGKPVISPFDLAGATAPQSGAEIHLAVTRATNLRQATPFEIAANIALFLQTIDDDGNPANGIEIPAQLHTLATGVSLNFSQKLAGFPADFTLRKLISDGRSSGLWGGTRPIRRPAEALDALYAGLGLTPTIAASASTAVDTDADSTADQRTTYAYDAAGRPTLVEFDADADGTAEQSTAYSYDADGRLISEAVDFDANGFVDQRTTYTYDGNGNLTVVEVDADGDGTADQRTTTTYDVFGNATLVEVDQGADGSVNLRYLYAYDVGGRLTLVGTDFDNDGNLDQRQLYTYNANGDRTSFDFDVDGNSSIDQRTTYTYDGNGNRTLEAFDAQADGIVDQRTTNSYDANGKLTLVEIDFDGDTVVDKRTIYAHDVNGNETLFQLDVDGNGTFESRTVTTYDANGNPTMVEGDGDGNGITDSRTTFFYDTGGNLTLKTTDNNADGTVDSRFQAIWTPINRWGAIL